MNINSVLYLAELVGSVGPGAVYQQGVEEHGVALLHVQVDPGVVLGPADAVVHGVHPILPVGVVVLLQDTLRRDSNNYLLFLLLRLNPPLSKAYKGLVWDKIRK